MKKKEIAIIKIKMSMREANNIIDALDTVIENSEGEECKNNSGDVIPILPLSHHDVLMKFKDFLLE